MSVLVVSLVVSLFLAGCSSSAKETLTVYNWADYIDESVIKEFEKEFDVRVIYDTFLQMKICT